MKQMKIGLLPLFIELYDRMWPGIRTHMEGFLDTIAGKLEARGAQVCRGRICTREPEFAETIRNFEEMRADALITLHLAYSPSLESARVLAATTLPIIVLDTTPEYEFGGCQQQAQIDYNHGIHGVQDMCNLLRRNGKDFQIEAGHWKESDVLDRVIRDAKAAAIAAALRQSRIGLVGQPFPGMGDFAVPADILEKTLGIQTIPWSKEDADRYLQNMPEDLVRKERASYWEYLWGFGLEAPEKDRLFRTAAVASLMIRAWMEEHRLTGFTANFLDVSLATGLPCMPFLEAGKAMARGKGYAGEGDILTAALVGALAQLYPQTSFVEMFCPDWKQNRIFLSHTGEMNLALTTGTPELYEVDYPYTDAANPLAAYGRYQPGPAVFVNLAPGRDNTYTLIVAPVEMTEVPEDEDFRNCVRGWLRPDMPLDRFLEEYSRAGGTHHAVLVYGGEADVIAAFGRIMGFDCKRLG